MSFTYPEAWPTGYGWSARQARKAAKVVHKALVTNSGASAVSHMTQGYARELAGLGRRSAETGGYEPSEQEQLRASAARSDALADLAATHWPISDPYGAMDLIALAEQHRSVDMDNPDAMIDLRSYFGRARVSCGAAAVALGPELKQFEPFIFGPVAFLDLEFATGLQHDWNYQADIWRNLLSDEPRPYMEFMQSQ